MPRRKRPRGRRRPLDAVIKSLYLTYVGRKRIAQEYRQALDTVHPDPGHSLSMECYCTGVQADPGCGTTRPWAQPKHGMLLRR